MLPEVVQQYVANAMKPNMHRYCASVVKKINDEYHRGVYDVVQARRLMDDMSSSLVRVCEQQISFCVFLDFGELTKDW